MAGNRCIADVAVTYVSGNGRPWGGTWGHIDRGIHRQISCSFPRMLCLVCYRLAKSFFLENNSLCYGGFCGDAEQKPTI